MPTYNVHLRDRVGDNNIAFWGEGTCYVIGLHIKDFFDQVCGSPHTSFTDSDYWWDRSASDVRSHELVIYFVNQRSDSLVRQASSSVTLGAGGTTLIRSAGNISEVYLTESLSAMGGGADHARGLAVLAFHEAMHNKLRQGGGLHSHSVGGGGMAATTVFANTQLTTQNINVMARALSTAVTQDTSFF